MVATRQATAGLGLADEAVVAELDDMPGAIEELFREPARAAPMVDRAAALVSRRFSWPAVAPSIPPLVLGRPAVRSIDSAGR